MLTEWSYDALATSLRAAPMAHQAACAALLEESRAGRVRFFWWDEAECCLIVQPAAELASCPVPIPLQQQYDRAIARVDHPALLVVTFYTDDLLGHPGGHVLRYRHVLWYAAQGQGIAQRPGREGKPATLHEVWARDLRDCLAQIFDGADPEESPG
jgi:hypothetical protein